MSHDGSWRAACLIRNWILILHFKVPSVARGVTAPGVGSGALLGLFFVLQHFGYRLENQALFLGIALGFR